MVAPAVGSGHLKILALVAVIDQMGVQGGACIEKYP